LSERSELKRIGAKPHKNSGRGMKKADGSLKNYVVDVKEYSKSFSISQDVWAKIVTDTIRVDPSKSPVIMLVLGEKQKVRLAIIEWNEFEMLKNKSEKDD
jgi:hypothetical protein